MMFRDLAVRLRSLWQALVLGIRRARAQDLPLLEVGRRALAALRRGPRYFVRALVLYAWPVGTDDRCVPEPGKDCYAQWIDTERRSPWEPVAADELVSIVMPVFNTPAQFLREAVESVRCQAYGNWELCIHDDASDAEWIPGLLEELAASDRRIRVSRGARQTGIAAATNRALEMASGRWVAFLDHDDVLAPAALSACIARLRAERAGLVYSDHDALNPHGRRCAPFFKPDWNLDLLLSQMYVGHLVVADRALVVGVGGLRPEMDGAQDYDLVLRCVSAGAVIAHEPRVLYHWRQHAGSTSANASSKPYAHHAGRRALQDFVDRRYPGAEVRDSAYTFCYDVRFPRPPGALASIIIPTRDRLDLLKPCVETIRALTTGQDYEIVVVDNGSVERETLDWFAQMVRQPDFRVIRADVPFNWSALNNLGAGIAKGNVLVFLNNDTEVVEGDWLARLVEVSLREDVGTCGPLLLYEDGSIQHAGVVVGMGGWADHVFKGEQPAHDQRLFVSPVLRRQVLAVTGACMAVASDTFRSLGGFDESFIVCGSDVELCLRARRAGLVNVYVGEARLVHHESKTRDPRDIPPGDFQRSSEAYAPYRTEGDPQFNPNLDPMSTSPRLRMPT